MTADEVRDELRQIEDSARSADVSLERLRARDDELSRAAAQALAHDLAQVADDLRRTFAAFGMVGTLHEETER